MPSLFLDTNFLLDATGSQRPGHREVRELIGLIRTGFVPAAISPHSLVDYFFITRQESLESRRTVLSLFLEFFDVVSLDKQTSLRALTSGESDYEDAVIGACAEKYKADYIITRDVRAFRAFAIPSISARDFLALATD